MKNSLIALIILILLAIGGYLVYEKSKTVDSVTTPQPETVQVAPAVQETTPVVEQKKEIESIGKSAGGADINAYHFGMGVNEIVFVGGIHGGYSWNTSVVANETIQWLKDNSATLPANVSVTVIPVLNPDGLSKVVDPTKISNFTATDVTASQTIQATGRFNGNAVDLNRNFECDWKKEGKWQNKTVSGGTEAFSEPEAKAVKAYIETHAPKAVVVWFSAAGGVYASQCKDGVLSGASALMNTYAKASGYPAHTSFDSYETSGDMTNWLASIKVPAISVLLTNHTDSEFSKNIEGVKAVIQSFK